MQQNTRVLQQRLDEWRIDTHQKIDNANNYFKQCVNSFFDSLIGMTNWFFGGILKKLQYLISLTEKLADDLKQKT